MHPADSSQPFNDDDSLDFAELFGRLKRGLALIFGLSLVGLAVGAIITLLVTTRQPTVSTLRVTFGFPGFERGTYPNGTKFQADDIRAPDVVNEAINRLGLQNLTADLSSKIRGAIGVSGLVPAGIVKERDKLRAAGQILPPYFPDEYEVSLSLPRDFALSVRQRELLLAEIINGYQQKFRRTFVDLPPEFGNAFNSLRNADFVEYELVLTKELQSLQAYLEQAIDTDSSAKSGQPKAYAEARSAKLFRSPTNNLSFQDLLKETELFTQIRLNDVLSGIYVYGLSKDRNLAVVKMDYRLRTLQDQEQRLKEEESVVTKLLGETQNRTQNYVLATKAQPQPGSQPMLDQGFIDTLLANDAYNFLVRRALDAGLEVKRVQADIARLSERRQRMESFAKGETNDQEKAIVATQKALADLEASYQALLSKVRVVLNDYSRQEYADAVRISMQAKTESLLNSLLFGAIIGGGVGLALGMGLSLLKTPAVRQTA